METLTSNFTPAISPMQRELAQFVESGTIWRRVCTLLDIVPGSGVAAWLEGEQIALVRPAAGPGVFAISNFDPFSKAFVMARGIVGDRAGIPKIASPIYKQSFSLETGECLDDPEVRLPVYPVRVRGGDVYVSLAGVV